MRIAKIFAIGNMVLIVSQGAPRRFSRGPRPDRAEFARTWPRARAH